jgi:hypothetical protein
MFIGWYERGSGVWTLGSLCSSSTIAPQPKCSPSDQNYDTCYLEVLAMVDILKQFLLYLAGADYKS